MGTSKVCLCFSSRADGDVDSTLIPGILELRPDVARQVELAETRRKELITARTEVVALLRRYTDFVGAPEHLDPNCPCVYAHV